MNGLRFAIKVDVSKAEKLFETMPELVMTHIAPRLRRAADEVAREERLQAPKALSTLANSIRAVEVTPLSYEIAPGVRYAVHVHEGTGPGGVPPPGAIEEWIRLRRITPKSPNVDPEDLPFLIRRKIMKDGIDGNPYAERTVEAKRERVLELANQGVAAAIAAMGSQA